MSWEFKRNSGSVTNKVWLGTADSSQILQPKICKLIVQEKQRTFSLNHKAEVKVCHLVLLQKFKLHNCIYVVEPLPTPLCAVTSESFFSCWEAK